MNFLVFILGIILISCSDQGAIKGNGLYSNRPGLGSDRPSENLSKKVTCFEEEEFAITQVLKTHKKSLSTLPSNKSESQKKMSLLGPNTLPVTYQETIWDNFQPGEAEKIVREIVYPDGKIESIDTLPTIVKTEIQKVASGEIVFLKTDPKDPSKIIGMMEPLKNQLQSQAKIQTGEYKVLFLIVNFTNLRATYTEAQAKADSKVLVDYYSRVSHKTINYDNDLDNNGEPDVAVVNIPRSFSGSRSSGGDCGPRLAETAAQALSQGNGEFLNGTNVSDYTTWVAITGRSSGCGYEGIATIGMVPTFDGSKQITHINSTRIEVVIPHELGHSLGLYHSGDSTSPYGDYSCTMGAGGGKLVQFNAPKVNQLGIFEDHPQMIRSDEGNGVYNIEALGTETHPDDSNTARVFKFDDLFVALRTKTGADGSLGDKDPNSPRSRKDIYVGLNFYKETKDSRGRLNGTNHLGAIDLGESRSIDGYTFKLSEMDGELAKFELSGSSLGDKKPDEEPKPAEDCEPQAPGVELDGASELKNGNIEVLFKVVNRNSSSCKDAELTIELGSENKDFSVEGSATEKVEIESGKNEIVTFELEVEKGKGPDLSGEVSVKSDGNSKTENEFSIFYDCP